MANLNPRAASATTPSAAHSAPWLGPWADVQRLQWQALLDWQSSMLAFHKDLWEQWVCRYGGGVPIDS
ncbi:MAG: hypothetical protein ABI641_01025 [Caldimonas sp.]